MKNRNIRKILALLLVAGTVLLPGCKKKEKKKFTDDLFIYGETDYFRPFQNPETSYCTENEGIVLPVYTQGMSGCFAYSAVTCVQAYLQKNGDPAWEATGDEIFRRMYYPKEELSSGKDGIYATVGSYDQYGGSPLHVCDVLDVEPLHGYVFSDVKRILNPSIDDLKAWIREYGAPVVSIHYNAGLGNFHGYPTQNYRGTDTNHFLCVVGWDDDFPAEAFSQKASQNGAFLVHNTMTPLGGSIPTYYWVSYDVTFPLAVVYVPTKEYSGGENNGFYLAGNVDPNHGSGEMNAYASIIRHEGELSAVGIFSEEEGCEYEIEILDGEFGQTLSSVSGTMDFSGYHLVQLDTPVSVKECTVVVRKTGSFYCEGESAVYPTPLYSFSAASVEGELTYVTHTDPGVSFIQIDGEWVDVTDEKLTEALGISEYTKYVGDPFLPVLFK